MRQRAVGARQNRRTHAAAGICSCRGGRGRRRNLLLLRFLTRPFGLVLGLWCIATALVAHTNFADRNMEIHFFKNVAMAGGFAGVTCRDNCHALSRCHAETSRARLELADHPQRRAPILGRSWRPRPRLLREKILRPSPVQWAAAMARAAMATMGASTMTMPIANNQTSRFD